MFTQNVLHYATGGVHHCLSFATFCTNSLRTSSFLLLYMSALAVHLCTTAALSVDANLSRQSAVRQTDHPHFQHHTFLKRKSRSVGEEGWSVDDWWHDTLLEDRQKNKNDAMGRLRQAHGRSFETPSADNDWQEFSLLGGTSEGRSVSQVRVEELFDEEDGIDTAESIPIKRRWPPANTVHFPLYPRTENTGDLDSAESTERKTSTGGKFFAKL